MSDYTFKGGIISLKKQYDTFKITKKPNGVVHVDLCRPNAFNSTDLAYYDDFVHFFSAINFERDVKCIVVTAQGKHFCSGLDLSETAPTLMNFDEDKDHARKALILEERIIHMQRAYTTIETCKYPVLVSVHGGCIGAGIDMITSCDIVYAADTSFFSIKEVDIGMTADLGTFQRLPQIAANWSAMKQYALTGEKFNVEEAKKLGIISKSFPTPEATTEALFKLADTIATKSPIAIVGIKRSLNKVRNDIVEKGLEDIRKYNLSQLFCNDVAEAGMASMAKKSVTFQKL